MHWRYCSLALSHRYKPLPVRADIEPCNSPNKIIWCLCSYLLTPCYSLSGAISITSNGRFFLINWYNKSTELFISLTLNKSVLIDLFFLSCNNWIYIVTRVHKPHGFTSLWHEHCHILLWLCCVCTVFVFCLWCFVFVFFCVFFVVYCVVLYCTALFIPTASIYLCMYMSLWKNIKSIRL